MAEAERIARFGVWKWVISSGIVRWSDHLHEIYGLRPTTRPRQSLRAAGADYAQGFHLGRPAEARPRSLNLGGGR
jgi:hypothetical protein